MEDNTIQLSGNNVLYTTYDPKTGLLLMQCSQSINSDGSVPTILNRPCIAGWHDPKTQYYDIETKQVKPRPEFPFKDITKAILQTNEYLILSSVPTGTMVYMYGKQYEVNDGVFEWFSPVPLTAKAYIECDPHIPITIDVEVTA